MNFWVIIRLESVLLSTSNEYMKRWSRFSLVLGRKKMIPVAMSYDFWKILNFSGNLLKWRWMMFSDPGYISLLHQQSLLTWKWEHQQKTPFSSTARRTSRSHNQQMQTLTDLLCCRKLVLLESESQPFLSMFSEICFIRFYCVCLLV